jgi:peptide-methionine (R)-S-oxide reductase
MRSALVPPLLLLVALMGTACLTWGGLTPPEQAHEQAHEETTVKKTEAEWRQALTPMQYHVLREKGTERPFTGEYTDTETVGVYCCAGCGAELFVSDAKFHSGCGWPSFFQPLDDAKITKTEDTSHGMVRTEVCCKRCGGHLGHVFDDGPPPTFLRFCINSASLKLVPR